MSGDYYFSKAKSRRYAGQAPSVHKIDGEFLTFAAIAERTGMTVKAVQYRMRRLRAEGNRNPGLEDFRV